MEVCVAAEDTAPAGGPEDDAADANIPRMRGRNLGLILSLLVMAALLIVAALLIRGTDSVTPRNDDAAPRTTPRSPPGGGGVAPAPGQ